MAGRKGCRRLDNDVIFNKTATYIEIIGELHEKLQRREQRDWQAY